MEVVVEFGLEAFNLFWMLNLFICKIASESFLFLSKLTDFKIGFFAEPDKLHFQIQLSDFKLIFFIIVQMIPFQRLNFNMVLILEF